MVQLSHPYMTIGKTIALTILLMCCHLIIWAAEIEALQREKLGKRAREDGTKGELRLEFRPWPYSLGSPSSASLLAVPQRSGGLGDPPDGAGTPSLFVPFLLEKPGKACLGCFPQRRCWETFSDRLLILQSKTNQLPESIKLSMWKGELPGPAASRAPALLVVSRSAS